MKKKLAYRNKQGTKSNSSVLYFPPHLQRDLSEMEGLTAGRPAFEREREAADLRPSVRVLLGSCESVFGCFCCICALVWERER